MMIDKILRSIEHIPAFPTTILKAGEMLKNDDYSVNDLTDLIKFDQAIAANVLKMSNSAYLSPRHRISTIRDAVIYLGQKNLLKVVQTAGVSRFFAKTGRGYAATANELWEHSVAVALMSQILARKILKHEDETLYLAALLHDVGKMVMGEFVYDASEKIMDLVARQSHSFLEAEEAVIGINHAALGGRIAVRWNYPEEIKNALTYHHRPDLAGEDDMTTWLVYLADQICLMAGFTGGMDGLAHRGVSDVMKKFDFYEKDLEMGMMQLVSDLQHARELVLII
jgi:putative nucleotidyltransferase with HDIG domain